MTRTFQNRSARTAEHYPPFSLTSDFNACVIIFSKVSLSPLLENTTARRSRTCTCSDDEDTRHPSRFNETFSEKLRNRKRTLIRLYAFFSFVSFQQPEGRQPTRPVGAQADRAKSGNGRLLAPVAAPTGSENRKSPKPLADTPPCRGGKEKRNVTQSFFSLTFFVFVVS